LRTRDFGKTWQLLAPHARPHRLKLVGVLLLGVVVATLLSWVIALTAPVLALVLFPERAAEMEGRDNVAQLNAFFRDLGNQVVELGWASDLRHACLHVLVVVTLVIALLGGLAQYGYTALSRWINYRMIIDLRQRLARHLAGLSLRYHGERQLGDLLSRLSSDVTTTSQAVNIFLKNIVQDSLEALSLAAVAAWAAPLPTAFVLGLLAIAALPLSRLTRRVKRGSRRTQTSLGASVQALTQLFVGIRTVKSFGGEERELERYRVVNEEYFRISQRMTRAIALTHGWTTLYTTAGMGVLILLLGWLTIGYGFFRDFSQMMVFLPTMLVVSNRVKVISRSLTTLQEAVGASERILALLAERADVVEHPSARPIHEVREGIRFEGVSFRYPGGEAEAIRELMLTIRRGETLALVGPSGSGKSTLIDLVARFIDPTQGRVTVDGVDLRELRVKDWNDQIALVGQVPFLFHTSLGENIRYGRPGAARSEVEAAARAADIHDFIAGLPQGYDTDAADMGTRLSGGQRQRITIARALLKGAPILLLDEATSALDSQSEAEVQKALERLMQGRTVIVIAHRLSTVRGADRIAVLDQGRLVELGTHEELQRAGGTYARLCELQQLAPEPVAATR
jgi:subfamily B ATP-binding cassette protein MsbA